MIRYDFVPLHIVAGEIAPNVARHHTEMNKDDSYGIPQIDWDTYLQASHMGKCFCATVRDDDKLVGYSVYGIGHNLRHKNIVEANSDGIFLEKEYRGMIGLKLQKFADEKLQSLGVQETNYITNDNEFGQFLEHNGYSTEYKVYSRRYNGQ